MIDLNTPPVEMISEGFSTSNSYGDEKDLPLISEESLHELVVFNDSVGESSAVKVRLYSVDLTKPQVHFAAKCTISLGQVPKRVISDIMTGHFESLVLKTDVCTITMYSASVEHFSYSEEDSKTCSLILDVSHPNIAKLEIGA